MIAFFVMSNLQIINVVNIKSNLYSNETADIFVSISNRVSKGLIDAIQKSNQFSNVYLLDATNAIKDIDLTKKFELSSIFGVIHEKNIYDAYLCHLPEKSYSKIFVPHEFVPSRYFILNLFRINPNMSIALYEEGSGSYALTKKQLCSNWSRRFKSKIWHTYLTLRFPRVTHDVREATTEIYLYQPQLYIDKSHLHPEKMPLLNSNNNICWNLLKVHSLATDNTPYDKRLIVYFVQEQLANICESKIMMFYLSILVEIIGSDNIIIKKHPWSYNIDENIIDLNSNIYIDDKVYFFESLFTHKYMKDKIFIAKDSSAIITPKIMFGYEPYVIFTYKLYPEFYSKNNERLNRMSFNLLSLYSDKTRIYIPGNLNEFTVILTKLNITHK